MNEQGKNINFPHLNIGLLRTYAKQWAKRYNHMGVERIVLYRYTSRYSPIFKELLGAGVSACYGVLFDFLNDEAKGFELMLQDACQHYEVDSHTVLSECECKCLDVLPSVSRDMDLLKTAPMASRYAALIDAGFKDVYHQRPMNDDFLKEWKLHPRMVGEELPSWVNDEETCAVLYESGDSRKAKPKFRPSKIETLKPFPCPEASWSHITMSGREDTSMIFIKNNLNGASGLFSCTDLGMENKKSKKPNSDWWFLYQIIANNGETQTGTRKDAIHRNKASRLSKLLQNLFGIPKSIWVEKKDMKRDALRRSCYISKFQTRKGEAFRQSKDADHNDIKEIFQDAQQKSSYPSLD